MIITKLTKLLLCVLLLGSVAVVPACKKGGGGGGDLQMPEPPAYETAFDELKDIPTQIDANIKWITQPLDDAHALGGEFNSLKDELGISAEDLGAMASVTFQDGTIEVSAELNIATEQRASVEAFLGKVKQVGLDVKSIPSRAKKVTGYLTKVPMKVPGLAGKATKELKAQLEAATAELKVEIEANIKLVPELQTEIVDKSKATLTDVKSIPTDSKTKVQELVLAFSGKGEFKAVAGGDAGDEEMTDDEGLGDEGLEGEGEGEGEEAAAEDAEA